jgi:bifunctional non-homologous end joining protein LigD
MALNEYRSKRDFSRTEEPSGRKAEPSAKSKHPAFVIQKHAASRLHYDFRLEAEGVLKSWAVPKGLPMRRGEKRLAVHVEDHPIDYARFEGSIPPGNYGAGTVMVWDRGSYQLHGDSFGKALESGKVHVTLDGEKLKGDWTFIRLRGRESDEKENWLVLKSGSDAQPIPERLSDRSVVTSRSLEEIAADQSHQWESDRPAKSDRSTARRSTPTRASKARPAAARKSPSSRSPRSPRSRAAAKAGANKLSAKHRRNRSSAGNEVEEADKESESPLQADPRPSAVELNKLPRRKAEFIAPMKCLLVDDLPKGARWLYEIKFDGYRVEAIKQRQNVSLISRNEKDLTTKYPDVAEALKTLPCNECVLDGEMVAANADGNYSFQLLQSYDTNAARKPALFYYAFDLMQLDGRDLTGLPLPRRKETLQKLLGPAQATVYFSPGIEAEPTRMLREMKARGLEGLVAKDKESKYEAGQRSGKWVKFKWTNEQEFVVAGYTRPQGTRLYLGAILIGYYENDQLLFASKVGSGFDTRSLELLYKKFQPLIQKDCPFANLPEKREGRWGQGITPAKMKLCTWLEPRLVCQVRFTEWTLDGHLRHPVFLGLRDDKDAKEVVREEPA